mmetsp:Transcript_1249/g.5341  ORF Transcript_1249/g.5341 Transcript_1249/m.5341 type:complete len:244 (-) Transcript_1249:5-736(-)
MVRLLLGILCDRVRETAGQPEHERNLPDQEVVDRVADSPAGALQRRQRGTNAEAGLQRPWPNDGIVRVRAHSRGAETSPESHFVLALQHLLRAEHQGPLAMSFLLLLVIKAMRTAEVVRIRGLLRRRLPGVTRRPQRQVEADPVTLGPRRSEEALRCGEQSAAERLRRVLRVLEALQVAAPVPIPSSIAMATFGVQLQAPKRRVVHERSAVHRVPSFRIRRNAHRDVRDANLRGARKGLEHQP